MSHQTLITISDDGDETHVKAESFGSTPEETRHAVDEVVRIFGDGKEITFRVKPEVNSGVDFITGRMNKGYVRFWYANTKGEEE